VNLIGEHTDYNEGFVLPVAIDRDTVIAARRRQDRQFNVYSVNRDANANFDLDEPYTPIPDRWINYVEGVARVLVSRGYELIGADMVILSDVPTGAGLSSSAALEISSALAFTRLARIPLDRTFIALAGQEAEHTYVGAMCGIMDQYISALGEEGNALLIDCRSLGFTPIPISIAEHALVICNTGVKHDLATSAYNDRRRECEQAVELLRTVVPEIRALRDVTPSMLDQHASVLPELLLRRARHVVTEDVRTLAAADALRAGDYETLSELLYASHASLRSDYEVSAPELDLLVEETRRIPGVFGSRMTGGGFGGCTVSFVRRSLLPEFEKQMSKAYRQGTGRDLAIYSCEIVQGAEEIIL
jgi:galactokinase